MGMGYFNYSNGRVSSSPAWEFSSETYQKNCEKYRKLTTSEIANKMLSTVKKYFPTAKITSTSYKYNHNIQISAKYYPKELGKILKRKIYFPIRIAIKVENTANPEPYIIDPQFRCTVEVFAYLCTRLKNSFDLYKNHLALQDIYKYWSFECKGLGIDFNNWGTPSYITNVPTEEKCVSLEGSFDLYCDHFGSGSLIDFFCMSYNSILSKIDEYNSGNIRDNLVAAIKQGEKYWVEK